MRQNQTLWLVFIVILAAVATWIGIPATNGTTFDFNRDGETDWEIQQPLGLDLVGGLRVLLEAELPPDAYTIEELSETANNVGRRVNALGLTEATIQIQGNNRILVELPGVSDPEQAIETIQQTALLEFVDFAGLRAQVPQLEGRKILTTEQVLINEQRQAVAEDDADDGEAVAEPEEERLVNPATGQPFETIMTGGGLAAASSQFDPTNNSYLINFELTPEGGDVFGPYTAQRIGEPMAIVLDGEVLSAPVIQAELPTGGVITGNFTQEEAETLALQLRSGALPIPLSVESTQTVGATLGAESVRLSIRAGVVGVIIVLAFMLIYYRFLGIAADLALLVFIILNLMLFKLVPVTLTLPAIAGFLISIGTAVDGNILIFERIKEELRNGESLDEALTDGFDRAWASIRDSNTSTIIICGILFLFGQTPGASIVSGFAVTLALGLILNLFTAVIVTRTFLNVIVSVLKGFMTQRAWTLGV